MIFTDLVKNYLSGKEFSNAAVVSLDMKIEILYRDDYLLHISKNKKILHLGFVDHIPLIDEKINKNKWLHKKLMDVSSLCYGVDINHEGIAYIKDRYGFENLYALDIINDTLPDEILNTHFDYILIPDVIEHIGNPVEFLSKIRNRFKNNVDSLVITTPNAFRLNNFINTFNKQEIINSDHRFWFSPFTLSKVVYDAGYKVDFLGFFEHSRLSKRQIFRKMLLSKRDALKDTLVIETKFL